MIDITQSEVCLQRRIQNRNSYLKKKKRAELKYRRKVDRTFEEIDDVISKLSRIEKNTNEIITDGEIYYRNNLLNSALFIFLGNSKSEIRRIDREIRKEITAEFKSAKNRFLGHFDFRSASNLVKALMSEDYRFIDEELRGLIVKELDSISDIFTKAESGEIFNEGFESFLNNIRGLKEGLEEKVRKFKETTRSHLPSYEDMASKFARSNIILLEGEVKQIENGKNKFFDSLEGIVLGYGTYLLELRRDVGNNDYSGFLHSKAEGKFSQLKKDPDEVYRCLMELKKKGFFDSGEFDFIQRELAKKFDSLQCKEDEEKIEDTIERKEKVYTKGDIEDTVPSMSVLLENGISREDAVRIARLKSYSDIDRVREKLYTTIGDTLTKLIAGERADIFLMGRRELNRYINLFNEVKNLAEKRNSKGPFNPYEFPENFASFESLRLLKKKLYSLHKTSVEEERGEKSEKERIMERLAKDGFDPEISFAILQGGFYFKGKYHTGTNPLNAEHLMENIYRRYPDLMDKSKIVGRELGKLIANDAVLSDRGYRLNNATKKIPLQSLRDAIGYVLTHNPLKEDRI